MFTTRFEAWVRRRAEALMAAIGRGPVTPNHVTVVGLMLTFVAAILVAFCQLRCAVPVPYGCASRWAGGRSLHGLECPGELRLRGRRPRKPAGGEARGGGGAPPQSP